MHWSLEGYLSTGRPSHPGEPGNVTRLMTLKSQLDLYVNHCEKVSHSLKLWLAVMDRAYCLGEFFFLKWLLGLG